METSGVVNSGEPPYSLAAEMAVLGAILFDNGSFHRVSDLLCPTDFYAPANRSVYEVSSRLISAGRVADGVTLHEHFEGQGELAEVGGASYLSDLLEAAVFGPEIGDYGRLVRSLSIRRSLIEIGSGMASQALRGDAESDGVSQIEDAERRLFDLASADQQGSGFQPFSDALAQTIEMAGAARQRDGGVVGVPTGLRDLNDKIGGLHRSDLIILAGRPSMGKTALATNMAFRAAERCRRESRGDGSQRTVEGAVVGFFSLEMSSEQLATRILSDIAGIESYKVRQGIIDSGQYESLREAAIRLESLPLYIDDTGGISISQIAARARRLQRVRGLDLLIIDYLQLIASAPGSRADGRVHEISRITQALKALAKDLDIPVLALSQLSRQVESRDDKRPQLSDLRESGAIEQDADVVIFVFREAYYLDRQEPKSEDMELHNEWKRKMDEMQYRAELIISKQRHGPVGKIDVAFDPRYVRFTDLMLEV